MKETDSATDRSTNPSPSGEQLHQCLKNHFLVAMPSLQDSVFSHTITLLCEHNENGAMGVIINSPLGIKMREVFEQMKLHYSDNTGEQQILAGGPVQTDRGFILHDGDINFETTIKVSPGINLTASKDIVFAIAGDKGPDNCLMTLGYAGWDGGQLEQEISENSWLVVPADPDIIFHTPIEHRWAATAAQLGIDLDLISTQVGHS
ncbi:MAG: YqgE/AlgH family protein [Cellvibrionaceae bacterium]